MLGLLLPRSVAAALKVACCISALICFTRLASLASLCFIRVAVLVRRLIRLLDD